MKKKRFEELLRDRNAHEVAEYDRPLFSHKDWVVAPTIGSIVPNWLLLIPRRSALNFRIWSEFEGQRPEQLLDDVLGRLGLHKNDIIWFEHGPTGPGTLTGCGLDHAHIHILIRPGFSFNAFVEKSKSLSQLEWLERQTDSSYGMLNDGRSYLIAGSGGKTAIAEDVETAGSQFFRRVVADLADIGDEWDYRRHRHAGNVSKTIGTIKSLQGIKERA